jgi:hypothetical protein
MYGRLGVIDRVNVVNTVATRASGCMFIPRLHGEAVGAALVVVVGVLVALRTNIGVGWRELGSVGNVVDPYVAEDAVEVIMNAVGENILGQDEAIPRGHLGHLDHVGLCVAEEALLVGEIGQGLHECPRSR